MLPCYRWGTGDAAFHVCNVCIDLPLRSRRCRRPVVDTRPSFGVTAGLEELHAWTTGSACRESCCSTVCRAYVLFSTQSPYTQALQVPVQGSNDATVMQYSTTQQLCLT